MSDTVRLFFALWPDPDVRNAMSALQANMHGRQVHPQDLHLTLAFLGPQPIALLPRFEEMLARLPACELLLRLDLAGHFARNRIAWVGPHTAPPALRDLHAHIGEALDVHGVAWRGERDYKPHVTLARDASAPLDLVFTPIDWNVKEVALVESCPVESGMAPGGPRYRVIARRRLDEIARVPAGAAQSETVVLGG